MVYALHPLLLPDEWGIPSAFLSIYPNLKKNYTGWEKTTNSSPFTVIVLIYFLTSFCFYSSPKIF
jgi:hypothetical protein